MEDFCKDCVDYPDGCEYCDKIKEPKKKWWLWNDKVIKWD